MKNHGSTLRFWNMAGNEGGPVRSVCLIKPLKGKANLNGFIGMNLVGFHLTEFTGLSL